MKVRTPNRQRTWRSCGNSQPSVQSFPIQRSTPQWSAWLRGISKKGLCLLLALEVFTAVDAINPSTVHSSNGPLNTTAAGYRNRTSGALNNVGSNGNWWTFAPNSQTNARNLNFNSGNVNPLNNNNRANGFGVWPVRESEGRSGFSYSMTYTYKEARNMVGRAYEKARQEERGTDAQLAFEMQMERNLKELSHELYERRWRPMPLDWFVNVQPTVREVFAPQFRDRIVSHVLFALISPIFERYFIYDSYSCRVGKGTLFGIERMEHHLRGVTDNWTREAFALNYDISGYFMSIVRGRLYDITCETLLKHQRRFPDEIDYGFADYLIFTFLSRDPLEGCRYYGDPGRIQLVLPSKSLRYQPAGTGIPIGDVINQLFSNIYLNMLDWYMQRTMGLSYYGRYVDDGKGLHCSWQYLVDCRDAAGEFLDRELCLKLHPNKTTITSVLEEPLYFLGAVLRPYRRHARNDSVVRFKEYVEDLDSIIASGKEINYDHALSVMSSRLGYMHHFDEYKAVYNTIVAAPHIREVFDFRQDLSKVILKTC